MESAGWRGEANREEGEDQVKKNGRKQSIVKSLTKCYNMKTGSSWGAFQETNRLPP